MDACFFLLEKNYTFFYTNVLHIVKIEQLWSFQVQVERFQEWVGLVL